MTTWTPTTKNTSSFSGQSKNPTDYSNQENASMGIYRLLIDDTYMYMIDDTHYLLLEDVTAAPYATQAKS